MNKKFFTLIASTAMLVASVGTVKAQIPEYRYNFAKYITDHAGPTAATPFQNAGGFAKSIIEDTYFHLGVAGANYADEDGVLAMYQDANTGEFFLRVVDITQIPAKELRFTLWTINYTGNAVYGYRYAYTNMGTGMQLSFDSNEALAVTNPAAPNTPQLPALSRVPIGGAAYNWQWGGALSTARIAPDKFGGFLAGDEVELTYSYGRAPGDSVMVLYKTGNANNDVTVLKYAANRLPDAADIPDVLNLIPTIPNPVLLSANDLNSMLWNDDYLSGVRFNFDKDVEGGNPEAVNLWTSKKYKATSAVGYPSNIYDWDINVAAGNPRTNQATYTALKALEMANNRKAFGDAIVNAYGNATDLPTTGAALQAFWNTDVRNVATGTTTYEELLAALQTLARAQTAGSTEAKFMTALIAYTKAERYYTIYDIINGGDDAEEFILNTIASTTSAQAVFGPFYTAASNGAGTWANIITAQNNLATAVTNATTAANAEKATNSTAISDYGWLSLYDVEAYEADPTKPLKYLMLDTAYLTRQAGNKHLKFNIKEWKDLLTNSRGEAIGVDADINATRLDYNGRYNYQFVWYPHADSLAIRVAGYAMLENSDNTIPSPDYFRDMTLIENSVDYPLPTSTDFSYNVINQNQEMNLVKIVVLADNHREVTVGNSELARNQVMNWTINTRIFIDASSGLVKTTLPPGIYFFKLESDITWNHWSDKNKNRGKYYVVNYPGSNQEYTTEEIYQNISDKAAQDFGHMPRTQWVVERNPGIEGQQTINIYNREYPENAAARNVQLYSDGKGNIFAQFVPSTTTSWIPPLAAKDTFSYKKVIEAKPSSNVHADSYLGYKYVGSDTIREKLYTLDYLSGLKLGNFANIKPDAKDTTLYVDVNGDKVYVQLVDVSSFNNNIATNNKYGYASEDAVAPQLYRKAYLLRVYDDSKLANNHKYIVRDYSNDNTYAVMSFTKENLEWGFQNLYEPYGNGTGIYAPNVLDGYRLGMFFLKENNQLLSGENLTDTTCYYALQEAYLTLVENTTNKYEFIEARPERVGVRDASLRFSIEDQYQEERVATFGFIIDNAPLYRRLGVTDPEDGYKDLTRDTGKIYTINSTAREYLYEIRGSKNPYYKEGLNLLGKEGKGDDKKAALFIDTAYVRNNTNMPQYMFAVDVTVQPAGMLCDVPEHNTPEYIANHGDCGHKKPSKGYVVGRYLINAEDSVQYSEQSKSYIWDNKYTRLAFVWAKHIEDTLIILGDDGMDVDPKKLTRADSIFLGDNLHNINGRDMSGGTLPGAVSDTTGYWKGDAKAVANYYHSARPKYGIKNAVFALRLIDNKPEADFLIESAGDDKIPSGSTGKWVAVKNGVPVIASYNTYSDAILDAERFNIERTNEIPTNNEAITDNNVKVVAGYGEVTVYNAANKKVTVNNVLGQTVAATIANSDQATIQLPKGIVVVSVDGEKAIKAIVK